jgi:hypothetical protein
MEDNQDAPLKITINGEEHDMSEVEELYNVGKSTRELETKYSTSFDKVWPEYGRVSTELSQAKRELDDFRTKQQAGTDTAQDRKDAAGAAQTLGLNPEELDKAGYIKKEQLDTLIEERLDKREQQTRAVQAVLDQATQLEKEIDGTDGRPKFNKRAVMAYASTYGIPNLQDAYEEMNDESIKPWKEAKLAEEKRRGLKTLNAGGDKQPRQSKTNDSNFGEVLREALRSGQE